MSLGAIAELRSALDEYQRTVADAPLAPTTKQTYVLHSENFVRWIEGDFEPGGRVS